MASGAIKGITISFNGDTTKLDKALREINNNTRSLDRDLKQVDNALKFNPTNIELWRQKQELLSQKVAETKTKLDALKQAQAQMDASGVDRNSQEYMELQRQIIVTENQVKNFEGQLRQVGNVKLNVLSAQFAEMGSSLENAGQKMAPISTAAGAVTGSIGAMAYKAATAADDLNTMAKVTGIGTQELQKYGYAADLVDVPVEAIAKANTRLKKSMFSARDGGSTAEAFEELGIAVTDANGNLRDSEDVFQETLKVLGSMPNEAERDALAMQLMGKSATELNPLIADQGETYKMVSELMKKYKLDYVDQDTLDKANQFNDSIDEMKLLGSVAFAQVGSQLSAYLAPALEKVVEWVGKFAEWLGNLDPKVLTVIATIGGVLAVVAPLLIGLGKLATGVSAVINLVQVIGPAIGGLASGPMLLIVGAIAAVIAIGVLLYKNWDKIKATAQAVGEKIKAVWEGVKTAVSAKIQALKDAISGAWDSIKTKTSNAWQSIKDAITRPFTAAKEKIDDIIAKVKSWFPIRLGNIFSNLKLPHLKIEGSFSLDPPSVPSISIDWYKKGGIFDRPSLIGVGEAGPEAVVPLDKFWAKLDKMQTGGEITINVYASPGQDVRAIAAEVERRLTLAQKQRSRAYGTI